MSLTVDVLAVEPLPLVRIEVHAEAGESWRVTGHTDDGEWLAGEGSGPAVFSDPWAPLGVAATYRAGSEESGPVLRSHRSHALTDLTGRAVVNFVWAPGDPWEPEPRATLLDVPGRPLSPFVAAPVAGAGSGAVTAKTTGVHTRAMRALIESNRSLILLHNRRECRRPDCDIPMVRTVMPVRAAAPRGERTDIAERVWDLTYRLVPRPYAYLAPVATWADVARVFPTFADVAATGMTNAELLRGDWLVGA